MKPKRGHHTVTSVTVQFFDRLHKLPPHELAALEALADSDNLILTDDVHAKIRAVRIFRQQRRIQAELGRRDLRKTA